MAKKSQKSEAFAPIFNLMIDLCEKNKTSVTALAEKYSNSKSTINAWKNSSINITILPQIANDLNVSIEYLLTGQEKQSTLNELSENEIELLELFKKFDDREQIKLIGKIEELYRQKQIKENQKAPAFKVARSTDGQFRKTELTEEELTRINNLPEDTDF